MTTDPAARHAAVANRHSRSHEHTDAEPDVVPDDDVLLASLLVGDQLIGEEAVVGGSDEDLRPEAAVVADRDVAGRLAGPERCTLPHPRPRSDRDPLRVGKRHVGGDRGSLPHRQAPSLLNVRVPVVVKDAKAVHGSPGVEERPEGSAEPLSL